MNDTMKRVLAYAPGAVVAAIAAMITAFTRWAGPAIYCGDGWFHVRYAAILRADGISRTFPWWQESFLATRFTDFNLLYHLLLIPFTWGNELTGARVASVVFAAAAATAFWWCARSLGVPWPAFTTLALLAIAPDFAYRLTYTRPLVLALALTFVGTSLVLRGRGIAAAVVTFLFAHTHCSFHLVPCLALLHDAQRTVSAGTPLRSRFSTTGWTLAGALAGSVLTPYFPNNLSFWWTANVGVLGASWRAGDLLRVGTEMLPLPGNELLFANLGVFALSAAALYGLTRAGRVSDEARTLLVVALGFFGLTLLSQRFAELWAPYTVLLAGTVARDLRLRERLAAIPVPPVRTALYGAALIVLAVGLRRTAHDNGAAAAGEDPPLWREAARWMKANVPPGETIFHLGWDEFPELFFEDTTHRYLIGQDATFFWVTDPERCALWARLARGRADDAWAPVRRTFGSRWAFVPRRYRSFLQLVRRDPRFTQVWADGHAVVFRVEDDGATVAGWEIAGRPPEGIAPRAALCSTGSFVELARAGDCAVATTQIPSEAGGPAVLGLTTDDEVTLSVNGERVFRRSPREPATVDLSSLLDGAARPGGEAAIPVTLRPGRNDVVAESCRVGEEFGFILRLR